MSVARAVQGLAITELEIITLAYTALNGVMCFFWWDKPLDVQRPVLIGLNGTDVPRRSLVEPVAVEEGNGLKSTWFRCQAAGTFAEISYRIHPLRSLTVTQRCSGFGAHTVNPVRILTSMWEILKDGEF